MPFRGIPALLLLVQLCVPARAQQVSAAKIGVVAQSVLQIKAHECETSGSGTVTEKVATGFIWRDSSSAVTAWHVVAGCSKIDVYYQSAKVTRLARVAKVSRPSDLALLTIDNAPQVTPLPEQPTEPSVNEDLETLGFPLQTQQMSSTRLNLRFGSGKLSDIIPNTVAQQLKGGSPSLELQITAIEGHLVPGLSGAPIFDGQGKVVAIADGGLENGAVGISWGVPVGMLHSLATSTDTGALTTVQAKDAAVKSAALFASESQARIMGELTCSGLPLTKIRTATFAQIAQTADDTLGLQQLINYFNVNPASYSFDVYQHLPSGATAVVPSGATVTADSKGCIASFANGEIVMRIELGIADTDVQVQTMSQQFEADAVSGAIQGWYPDNTFSYLAPIMRFDGLVVRRKAFVHLNPALIAQNSIPQDRYLFETIATRRHVLVTETVLNNVATLQNNQLAILCRQNTAGPNCGPINLRTDAWITAVLAVQLTTFPVG